MHLALYQPDIPQNAGTLLRLGACLDVTLHIVGPAGFDFSDRRLKRAGLDYLDKAKIVRHIGWADFEDWRRGPPARRLILLTTKAPLAYLEFRFQPDDVLMLGRESVGVPASVHEAADARLAIPMAKGLRSINVALSGAMVLGEALRQTNGFAHLSAAVPVMEKSP